MGGILQGLVNAAGGVLGETDSQYQAKKAGNQSAQQQTQANVYGQAAGNLYGGLASQGQGQVNAYNNNYLNLLDLFGGVSGLGSNVVNTNQRANVSTGGSLANGLNNRTTPAQILSGQGANPGATAPGANGQPAQGAQGGNSGVDPYALDPNEQTQLNQSLAGIAQAHQSALSSFKQEMSNAGLTDPRDMQVGEQQLNEHFSALQAQTQTQFFEQIKSDKLKALQEIMSSMAQYGQQGIQEQEAAGSGLVGLYGGSQSQANVQQNVALQQNAANQEQFSGLLNLIGFGASGGFGGG